jgi:hypothetical protein
MSDNSAIISNATDMLVANPMILMEENNLFLTNVLPEVFT